MTEIESSPDIVVVGAAAAGLGAGHRLKELGLSFVLLEASHRVGGRGYTEDLAPGVPFGTRAPVASVYATPTAARWGTG